jgi:hypothetical protein
LPATQKGDEHSLSTQKGEEKYPSSCEEMASKYYFVINLLRIALFFPPSLFSASQSGVWIPRPNIAFSPRVKSAESGRGWVGGGLGSPLAGFSPNTEISFLMISPNLLDICPVFLLVFSPLETADLLILF